MSQMLPKSFLLLVSAVLLSLFSLASAECANNNNCSDVMVDRIYIDLDDDNEPAIIYIGTSGDESLLACDAGNYDYIILDSDRQGADLIYSTLLTAQSTANPVFIRADTNEVGRCIVNYVVLDRQP